MASISRRQLLALLASGAATAPGVWASPGHPAVLLAAWQSEGTQQVGLLAVDDAQGYVQQSLTVPTRAHGLWAEAGGSVLAVARRPGDWLLRWHPASGQTQWHWIGEDRRFNGHVIARADGARLWTTETDLDTAQGRIGMRDAKSLEKTAEWASNGMDPHQLLTLPQAVGDLPTGTLMVANGGIPTLPETGRSKREIGRMDASLVALDPGSGALLGQWRLDDPHLSIRHLAFDPLSCTLGIALQAEHATAAAKSAAPVLAVWDGMALRTCADQPPMAGYGGDICALPAKAGGGFAVSCPRRNTLALFGPQAQWRGAIEHREAYALAGDGHQWWLASSLGAAGIQHGADEKGHRVASHSTAAMQIDNHWALLGG